MRVELCVALGEYLKTGVPLPSICAAPFSVKYISLPFHYVPVSQKSARKLAFNYYLILK